MFFQEPYSGLIALYIFIPVFIITEIVLLKIGLMIVKARERKNLYWVIISFFIQSCVISFVFVPFILFGIAGEFEGKENYIILLIILLLALFLDYNLINIIHQLGAKRTLVVFLFFAIPFSIFTILFGNIINSL
ncbi:MAG: hypothetical protein ACTSXH_17035 [Promethearchaeota archaeon]